MISLLDQMHNCCCRRCFSSLLFHHGARLFSNSCVKHLISTNIIYLDPFGYPVSCNFLFFCCVARCLSFFPSSPSTFFVSKVGRRGKRLIFLRNNRSTYRDSWCVVEQYFGRRRPLRRPLHREDPIEENESDFASS